MVNEIFLVTISILIILRSIELSISKRNENFLRARGAVEFGAEHYKYIVSLHVLFFVSVIIEFLLKENKYFILATLILLIIIQLVKLNIIMTLGKYWNTKILRIKGSPLIKKGLYKYFRHPNYIIVACEIFLLPLTFGLYFTLILFSILNAIMLYIRINVENNALKL